MEKCISRVIAVSLGVIGVAFLAVYPFTRIAAARERADIDRAWAPLVSVPLEQLQAPGGLTLHVTIPNDTQWKRITDRLGSPSFLFVAASARGETRRERFPPADLDVSLRVSRNATDVPLLTTSDIPDGYSVGTATNGLNFAANPADPLDVHVGIGSSTVPAGSVFLLVPQWSTSSVSAWAEGAGYASIIVAPLALASALVGMLLVWWALTIAWGRPETAA
jgi:hypothetical protein